MAIRGGGCVHHECGSKEMDILGGGSDQIRNVSILAHPQ